MKFDSCAGHIHASGFALAAARRSWSRRECSARGRRNMASTSSIKVAVAAADTVAAAVSSVITASPDQQPATLCPSSPPAHPNMPSLASLVTLGAALANAAAATMITPGFLHVKNNCTTSVNAWPVDTTDVHTVKAGETYVQRLGRVTGVALKEARPGCKAVPRAPDAIVHSEPFDPRRRPDDKGPVAAPHLSYGLENLANREVFSGGWELFPDDTSCHGLAADFGLSSGYNLRQECANASTNLTLVFCPGE